MGELIEAFIELLADSLVLSATDNKNGGVGCIIAVLVMILLLAIGWWYLNKIKIIG